MQRRQKLRKTIVEPLEIRTLLTAQAVQVGDVAWLADMDEPHLQRFDLDSETWLPSIILEDATSAPAIFNVDADGIYTSDGHTLTRYDMDGTGAVNILTAPHEIISIHTDGNLLLINMSYGAYTVLASIDKTTNAVIDSYNNLSRGLYGDSLSVAQNRIFGRTQYVSPGDTHFVSYTDDGYFQTGHDSPYHGDFPDASGVWATTDGLSVVDDFGVHANIKKSFTFKQ